MGVPSSQALLYSPWLLVIIQVHIESNCIEITLCSMYIHNTSTVFSAVSQTIPDCEKCEPPI